MDPTGKIPPQPWMTSPETRDLMKTLKAGDIEARFIGGCVRDSILKRPVKDIDIATPAEPEKVISVLEQAGVKVIPTGIEHGTITAIINKHHFEITTLRIDVETDGRRATVAYTDDWTVDAARRDFTINTMSANEDGDIFDPYGGLDDLGRGNVRFVGIAQNRINEDVLRMLRFFRFYAEYGKPPMNAEALIACRKLAPRLKELSGERVRGELLRILMAPNPADTIVLMKAENILEQIMPEAGDVGRLRALSWLVERGITLNDIATDPVRRLGALVKPGASKIDVDTLCERLKFSKREHKHLSMIACSSKTMSSLSINSASSEKEIRRACYHLGKELVTDKALIEWAGEISTTPHQKPGQTEKWENVLASITAWQQVRFPLQGRHGINLGMEPGPELGQVLGIIEQWWVDGDFRANENDCIEQLRQKLQQNDSSLTTI